MRIRIFENRAFAVDNAVLFLLMIAFVPLFFFASMYAQISLGESASETGLYLLIFFAGFFVATQRGGKILDERGARPTVVLGCLLGAVGFALWAQALPDLSVGSQWPFIVLAGVGVGLVLSPANTDALNRVPRSRYGEATGITQTVRNFGASLGLAVLGTVLILENKSNLEATLGAEGLPKSQADQIADALSESGRRRRERLRRTRRRRGAEDLLRRPVRLRPLLAHGLLRHGGGDGGRLPRRPDLDALRQGAGAGRGGRDADRLSDAPHRSPFVALSATNSERAPAEA